MRTEDIMQLTLSGVLDLVCDEEELTEVKKTASRIEAEEILKNRKQIEDDFIESFLGK